MVIHCISNSHFPNAMLTWYLLDIHMCSLIKCLQKAFAYLFFFFLDSVAYLQIVSENSFLGFCFVQSGYKSLVRFVFCKPSSVSCLHFLNNTIQSTNHIEFLLSFSLPIPFVLVDGFSLKLSSSLHLCVLISTLIILRGGLCRPLL